MSVEKTLKQRGKIYGDFMEQSKIAIELHNLLADALSERETALDYDQSHALIMICTKIARIINGDPDYADNWHDIAGYATLVAARLATKEAK